MVGGVRKGVLISLLLILNIYYTNGINPLNYNDSIKNLGQISSYLFDEYFYPISSITSENTMNERSVTASCWDCGSGGSETNEGPGVTWDCPCAGDDQQCKNWYTKSTVQIGSTQKTDFCLDANTLLEYYMDCWGPDTITNTQKNCNDFDTDVGWEYYCTDTQVRKRMWYKDFSCNDGKCSYVQKTKDDQLVSSNGDSNFCDLKKSNCGGCKEGESDCDSNSECASGLHCSSGSERDYCCPSSTEWDGDCCTWPGVWDLKCYNNDVYKFDRCGYNQGKYEECFDDYCEAWSNNYCKGGHVYHSRTCYDRGCSGGSCFSNTNSDEQKVQDCGTAGCSGGSCCTSRSSYSCSDNDVYYYSSCGVKQEKKEECGDDYCDSWSSNYCEDGHVYHSRTCYDKGCSGNVCTSSSSTQYEKVQDCGTTGCLGSSCCTSHYYSECDDNDVYYFSSCSVREDKKQECGEDGCDAWEAPYCKDNDVYHTRTCHHRYCSSICKDDTSPDEQKLEECGVPGCSDGVCNKCWDNDNDGYLDVSCGGIDCNDNYANIYPGAPELCDNKDNDCDTSIDESLTKTCGSGNCQGTQTCSAGVWGDCSTKNSDCGTCAKCDGSGSCTYDSTQDNDCGLCQECSALFTCFNQADGSDVKNDCVEDLCAFGYCDGLGACKMKPPTTVCRSQNGICDLEEKCTGQTKDCPADAKSTAQCRASAGDCDIAELCDGISNDCLADAFKPQGTDCGVCAACDGVGTCTYDETQDNDCSTIACPDSCTIDSNLYTWDYADDVVNQCTAIYTCSQNNCNYQHECSVDSCSAECDLTYSCSNTKCDNLDGCVGDNYYDYNNAVNNCLANCICEQNQCSNPTIYENDPRCIECQTDDDCTYLNNDCADGVCNLQTSKCEQKFKSSTTICRTSAGVCDTAEYCTGQSPTCPSDSKSTSECRATVGDCDLAENCDGINNNCPSDLFKSSSIECRASAGICDIAEHCTGSSATCPVNSYKPQGTDCGICAACDALGSCTYDETQDNDCDGVICPADGCGIGNCGQNIFGDYPNYVPNECFSIYSCTKNVCTATCEADNDDDGYSVSCGDCDDNDNERFFNNPEICDNRDNNCDYNVDENFTNEECEYVCLINGFAWTNNGGSLNCCGNDNLENAPYEVTETTCNDGHDNDCDGLIDGNDQDCWKPPIINILSPINNTIYQNTSIDLNWTVDKEVDWCGYSLDGEVNNTNIHPNYLPYQEDANYTSIFTNGDIGYLYVNYTKPSSATSLTKWQVKHGYNGSNPLLYNITLPQSCWNAYKDKLALRIYSFETLFSLSKPQCYDSHTWIDVGIESSSTLFSGSGRGMDPYSLYDGDWTSGAFYGPWSRWWVAISGESFYAMIYEEAIWWDISLIKSVALTSLSEGPHNITIYCNDTYGNIGQSDYVYFIVEINEPPKINQISCQENNSIWRNCSNINYYDTLTGIGVNCSDANDNIDYVNIRLNNLPDNKTIINYNITSKIGDYWSYSPDILIEDSGNWSLDALCIDQDFYTDNDSINWYIPFGYLEACLISPLNDTNVSKNKFFNFSSGIKCIGGECGDVNVTLDPIDSTPKTCSETWGFDCGTGPPESGGDNTFDDCSNGAGDDESINEIYLDKNKVEFGEEIEVKCNVVIKSLSCGYGYTGDRLYIHYRNSPIGTWQKKYYISQVYSCSNYSIKFIPDNVKGEHQVRCSIDYYQNDNDGCSDQGSWYDNDDINFTVEEGLTLKGTIPMNNGTPFYTISQNPTICPNMKSDQSCNTTWLVNATGEKSTEWEFYTIYTPIDYSSYINSKETDKINIKILNRAPLLNLINNITVNETDLVEIIVSASDPNGDDLTYTINDTRFNQNENVFTWQTLDYSAGFYVINITVSDYEFNVSQLVTVTVNDVCIPNWIETNTTCRIDDTKTGYYIDNNSCYEKTNLTSDLIGRPENNTYDCNYCSEDIQGHFYTDWAECNRSNMQSRIKYYSDLNYNTCCVVTGLDSDCHINNGTYNNITEIQNCDYCTPNWVEINTSCRPDNTIIGWYNDTNNCFAKTNLSSDNNPPENNTYPCIYTYQYNIPLNQNWNLISLPLNPINNSITSIFKNINFSSIFAYNETWLYYYNETKNNFNIIEITKGYWINSLNNQTLTIEGTEFTYPINFTLKKGWNLISYPSLNKTLVNESLKDVACDLILTYEGNKWLSYSPNKPFYLNTLKNLTPYHGYWIKVNENVIWGFDGAFNK